MDLTATPEWKALAAHYDEISDRHLRDLFAGDDARAERMTTGAADLSLDYSKHRVTDETLRLLMALARAAHVEERKLDPARWLVTRGIVLLLLVLGWVFIAWQNKFHVTAAVAFVCLGYLAVMMTVVNLWRTGAAAMAPEHAGEEAWSRPIGERGELEKEKKALLKAIKECEFDLHMGKLSRADADAMIQTYRARAIAVIKELERFEELDMKNVDPAGRPLAKDSVRDQIAREVKARIELAGAKKSKKSKAKAEAAAAAPAETPAPEPTDNAEATS